MRYVAIGDSFTEGVGDERADGSLRGWADRVAEGLADATGTPVAYANLAIRGRKLGPIVQEQLEPALALAPTLVTYNGGGNDIMRRNVEMGPLMDLSRLVVRRCREAGVRLIVLAGPDPTSRIPLGQVVHRRGEELTADIVRLTDEAGLAFVDMWHDREIRRPGYWGADRIHLNPAGHRRVARQVLAALGHPPAAEPPTPVEPRRSLADNLLFYRQHVAPWVRRRVQGRSSGDHRTAKHPDYVTISPDPGRRD
ncbi:SGNH/GDSL hydrolase family protein [Nakamurella sp.]|uniref:SGNH/GDSL hydrolase family protein n=1 Tax=Nakamurella sp. TaxID=1869182 RepID=UPI003B3BB0DC